MNYLHAKSELQAPPPSLSPIWYLAEALCVLGMAGLMTLFV